MPLFGKGRAEKKEVEKKVGSPSSPVNPINYPQLNVWDNLVKNDKDSANRSVNPYNPDKDKSPQEWRGRPDLNLDKKDGPIGFPSYDKDKRREGPRGYFPEPRYTDPKEPRYMGEINKAFSKLIDKKEDNIEDFEADKTYSFPKSDMTEEEAKRAKAAGYVYIPEFKAGTDRFCCGNCEYIMKANTTTGYWCRKFKFPDRPEACSDGFEPK
jgi:hypothetical protein